MEPFSRMRLMVRVSPSGNLWRLLLVQKIMQHNKERSLLGSPVLQVWNQLLNYTQLTTYFRC